MSTSTPSSITCPDCGGSNLYADQGACHTWPGGNRKDGSTIWMACQNCGSACDYACWDCQWRYTHGLNPNNPRASHNDENRPPWITNPAYDERLVDGWEYTDNEYFAHPIGWVDPEEQETTT